jgi:pyridoxal phosphate-dependent aminotransferase EpsN
VLDERVKRRREIAFAYRAAFAGMPGIDLAPQAPYGLHTNWLSCFVIDEKRFGASRDDVGRALSEADIEWRPLWKPMHLQPLFRSVPCWGGEVAADLFRRGICLPSSSSLTPEEQVRVIDAVKSAARHA